MENNNDESIDIFLTSTHVAEYFAMSNDIENKSSFVEFKDMLYFHFKPDMINCHSFW